MDTGERQVLKQQEVKGFEGPAIIAVNICGLKARDGVEVPVSLVYRREHFRKGRQSRCWSIPTGRTAPAKMLISSASRLSLLDRGFVFAIAHVRGGGGGAAVVRRRQVPVKRIPLMIILMSAMRCWRKGYDPRLVLRHGRQRGLGMLMASLLMSGRSCFTARSGSGSVCRCPDHHVDEPIPLTTGEFEEWGNPQDEEYYRYMKSYSPYDGVTAQAYPHLLVTTACTIPRCNTGNRQNGGGLRELKTDDNLLLLCTDMDSGTAVSRGVLKAMKGCAGVCLSDWPGAGRYPAGGRLASLLPEIVLER